MGGGGGGGGAQAPDVYSSKAKGNFSLHNTQAKVYPYKILTEIWPIAARSRRDSRRDLCEIPGEFLAAEISGSLANLGENLAEISARCRRDSRRAFGRRDLGKILARSRLSRRDLGNLAEISVISARSRQKFCTGN